MASKSPPRAGLHPDRLTGDGWWLSHPTIAPLPRPPPAVHPAPSIQHRRPSPRGPEPSVRGSKEPWPASLQRQRLRAMGTVDAAGRSDRTGGGRVGSTSVGPWAAREGSRYSGPGPRLPRSQPLSRRWVGWVPRALTAADCPRGRGQWLISTEAAGLSPLTEGAPGSLPDLTAADQVDAVSPFPEHRLGPFPTRPRFCPPTPIPQAWGLSALCAPGRGGPEGKWSPRPHSWEGAQV